jgi:formate-dependent nitrite reductase cytochrome c552 subunit
LFGKDCLGFKEVEDAIMKARMMLVLGTFSLAAMCAFWQSGWMPSAVASDEAPTISAAARTSLIVAGIGEAEYVGSGKCKKCHLAEHKSWEKTRHGTAMETLKPGNATEAKTKYKLDPAKDYTKDATCVACHVTGFGKPGGYQVPADEEAAKKMKALEGVGCEVCHGAGGSYLAKHEEIMKSKGKYTDADMIAVGMKKVEATVCAGCHNDKGPTFDAASPFDFAKAKENPKGVHEHTPLKQKE